MVHDVKIYLLTSILLVGASQRQKKSFASRFVYSLFVLSFIRLPYSVLIIN